MSITLNNLHLCSVTHVTACCTACCVVRGLCTEQQATHMSDTVYMHLAEYDRHKVLILL